MKIRTLIAAFSLIVAVPVMQVHAADTAADVTASITAQVKADPSKAAAIVAAAIAANPALAPAIAAAAVKAAPGQAKAITAAAVKAAPTQIAAIAKAETQAVPAQANNIYVASIQFIATNPGVVGSGSSVNSTLSSLAVTLVQGLTGNFGSGSGSTTDLGEKVSATVSSPAA